MKYYDALRVLAELTTSQWGLVTSAQAAAHGISRLQLSRFAEAGHLRRVAQGVYMDSGAPSTQIDDLRAVWLSTEPKVLAEERIASMTDGAIVASTSAAYLHGIGDFWPDRHEFVAAGRRQTQRTELRYRQRTLESQDVTLVEGLPTMTLERTIADLIDDVGELSLVADALRDASSRRALDLVRLEVLFEPLAARNGYRRNDGHALLDRLMRLAGIDDETRARRIASDPSLGPQVVARYFENNSQMLAQQLMKAKPLESVSAPLREELTGSLQKTLSSYMDTPPVVENVLGSQSEVCRE